MGYALFASRKIMLTDRVNNLQLELTKISDKRNKLLQLSSAVSDGEVSAYDLAQCQDFGLAMSYKIGMDGQLALSKTSPKYQYGRLLAEKEAHDKFGGSKILNAICGVGTGAGIGCLIPGFAVPGAIIGGLLGGIIAHKSSAKNKAKNEEIKEYQEAYNEAQIANMVADIQEEISKMDNKLDKKEATLETRLTAAQAELEATEQAETKGIQNATPKYAGLG
ncbi:hypothetical protein IJD15_03340 [bacterium]|nr:hypothetical protein [bacterium]MBQ4122948.1 hypothetical protein [bacterium]